jgi:hypothetical protein
MAFDLSTAKPYRGGFDLSTAKPYTAETPKSIDYRAEARKIAQEEGVDPDLFDRVIAAESSWNPNAKSKAGAIGFGQLMPGTAKDLNVDPTDPLQNLRGSARYLAQQLKAFGTPELALAAYNAGPGTVRKSGNRIPNYPETKNYIAKITGKSPAEFMREDLKKAPWLERQLVGAGGAMVEGWEGLKGIVGMSDPEELEFTRVAQQEAPAGSIVGNVAMMAPTMAIPGVNTVGGAAAVGGLYNALTTPGDVSTRRNAAAMGVLGGGAGQGVSNALSKAFIPNRTAQNLLSKEGVTLTPGQNAGGMWKNFEDKAMSIPFLGDAISGARMRGIEDFNRAAIQRATIPGLDVDGIGNAAIQDLRQGLGASFDDIAARSSIQGLDQEFMQNMVNLGQMAQQLPAQEAREFTRVIQRELIERLGPNGQLSGKSINEAIAGIRDRAAQFKKSPGAWERDLGNALDEAAGEVFSLMERTNPQLASELLKTKKAYANFKTLQRASSGVGAEGGVFTPAQLHSAVKAGDKTKDKRAFSEGAALLQDLTSAGKAVMPSKLPNSGTADRLMGNIMNPLQWPGLAGGALASIPALAMYSRPGAKTFNALYDAISSREMPNALRLIMNPVLTQQLE